MIPHGYLAEAWCSFRTPRWGSWAGLAVLGTCKRHVRERVWEDTRFTCTWKGIASSEAPAPSVPNVTPEQEAGAEVIITIYYQQQWLRTDLCVCFIQVNAKHTQMRGKMLWDGPCTVASLGWCQPGPAPQWSSTLRRCGGWDAQIAAAQYA